MKLSLYRTRYQGIEESYILLPDGITYLSAYINKYMPETEMNITYNSNRIMDNNPDVVALSGVSVTMADIKRISADIKKQANIPIILGGVHITYLPNSLPDNIDIGVISEGEITFLELMQLAKNKELVPEKLKDVDGIVYRDYDGSLKITKPRALVKDIDILPLPTRHVHSDIPLYQVIYTSRGCVYKCRYCVETNFWVKTRFHSTERVFEEICQIIRDFPEQTSITFGDTIFAVHKKRLREITELIVEAGINKKVSFSCNARANIFDEETAELFLKMNMKQINFGFESASDDVLDFMKGKVNSVQNQKALDLCDKYGFIPLGHFLVASPVEKKEDLSQTYWFLRKNYRNLWRINVTPLIPLPGTEFWHQSKAKGYLDEQFDDWEDFRISKDPPILLNENYTASEFSEMRVWFDEIVNSNRSERDTVDGYFTHEQYLEAIYKKLLDYLKSDDGVLEVSNNIRSLDFFSNGKVKTDKITIVNGHLDWSNFDSRKKFSQIVMVHSLEQLRNPVQDLIKLKANLAEKGNIICLFYNAVNLDFISRFLFKDGIDKNRIWGPTEFKNIHFLSLSKVKNIFHQSGFIKMDKLYSGYNNSPVSSDVIKFIKENFSVNISELSAMCYIVKIS